MKKILHMAIAICMAFAAMGITTAHAYTDHEFSAKLMEYFNARDARSLLMLLSVTAPIDTNVNYTFKAEMDAGLIITSVKLTKLAKHEAEALMAPREYSGRLAAMASLPYGRLDIKFDMDQQSAGFKHTGIALYVGKQDGNFHLIGLKLLQDNAPPAPRQIRDSDLKALMHFIAANPDDWPAAIRGARALLRPGNIMPNMTESIIPKDRTINNGRIMTFKILQPNGSSNFSQSQYVSINVDRKDYSIVNYVDSMPVIPIFNECVLAPDTSAADTSAADTSAPDTSAGAICKGTALAESRLESTATLSECKAQWTDAVISATEPRVAGLSLIGCATIDYAQGKAFVLDSLAIVNKPDSNGKGPGARLLAVGLLPGKTIAGTNPAIRIFHSSTTDTKDTALFSIQAIADINGDGRHEIILRNDRGSGPEFSVMRYDDGHFVESRKTAQDSLSK